MWETILLVIWVVAVVISFGGWLFKINNEQFEKEKKLDEDTKSDGGYTVVDTDSDPPNFYMPGTTYIGRVDARLEDLDTHHDLLLVDKTLMRAKEGYLVKSNTNILYAYNGKSWDMIGYDDPPDINRIVNNLNQLNTYTQQQDLTQSISNNMLRTVVQESNERHMRFEMTMNEEHDYIVKIGNMYVTKMEGTYDTTLQRNRVYAVKASETGHPAVFQCTEEKITQYCKDIAPNCFAIRVDIQPGITFGEPKVLMK